MPDLLVEIGCEEIPARMIAGASQELGKRVGDLLRRERLSSGTVISLDTPRRLAVIGSSISAEQPSVTEQLTGPAVSIAFKDGQPTGAALAFAKKAGVEVAQLEKVTTPKGEYLAATVSRKGRHAAEILGELLPKEINSLYWPKSMYWQRPSERFIRPIRWVVAMLDGQVVPLEIDGVRAGNASRGHRVIGPAQISILNASSYADTLRGAKVLGAEERLRQIRQSLDAATRTVSGARWREDTLLLDTVVNLTEFPCAILGGFDPEFLTLPEEVLVTVMRDHQKYFAVEDSSGKLLPYFLAVLNTDGDPQGIIRHGHERVLRARFNDARFFWETDQKHPLRERFQWLKKVTFQKDLGNYHEKMLRVQRLCSWISQILKQGNFPIRPGVVHKAALLAKTDLTTELVKEFTELQGVVGGLYARVQELDSGLADETRAAIATAVYDHYKPVSMEDPVPRTTEGAVLSIADKADSIVGMFGLGLQPTGSKDPFALRRQANGIVRIIAEHKLPLRLDQLFEDAREAYRGSSAEKKFSAADSSRQIAEFLRERVEFYLREGLGFKYDVVNAVLAADSDDVVDAAARAGAVSAVRASADFESISVAFKRVKNILRQARESGKEIGGAVDSSALTEDAEKELAAQIPQTVEAVEAFRGDKKYDEALLEVSRLRGPVDRFFDKVMVMVDDQRVRANRLALLQTLLKEFSTIADFSEIVTEGTKES